MKKVSLILAFLLFTVFNTFSQQDEDRGTGLDFSQEKYESIPMSAPILTRSYTNLPKSFSLKAYAPTPGDQGRQPSCVGWASGYGARTIAFAIKNNWKYNKTKINQNAFSPSFVYNQIKATGDNNCTRGSYIADAMKLMNNSGILKKSEFSYNPNNCTTKPTSYALQKAKNHKILTFERLAKWDNPYNLVGKVKKAIANKNPVVIGMFRYGKLGGFGELWTPPANAFGGGHAMVVVGYDDTKYGGAFEIMNSWGTRFRNGGFFWVRYNDFKKYTKTAYVLVDNAKSIPNKIDNNTNTTVTKYYNLSGEITLKLSNGRNMIPTLSSEAKRNFNIVKAGNSKKIKTTYSIDKAYSSGTQFRIYLKSKQRGYVYLIGYGGSDKSVNKLYPFENFSPFFNYTNSEIAIPNEDYYIEFDNKPGQDILCVLYSKERLNINTIISKVRYGSGDFVANMKKALQYKMFKGSELTFDSNKIAFKASSNSSSSKVVPIFISVNHQ
ncbi:C1 family peptidase [Pseudotenacibaculum sp. MALMAid0570]|uniref:C1 family peptidase n=1 Tax=Pseudotenacibaculum sp. MALMAid0570 TaxID=3143938 RepID=UPI0032DFFBA8